jgi:hypothetical protein
MRNNDGVAFARLITKEDHDLLAQPDAPDRSNMLLVEMVGAGRITIRPSD